jgi:hypothetical protein
MRAFLLIIALSFSAISADSVTDNNKQKAADSAIDESKLKIIEDFLSTMDTLEADMTMDIDSGNNIPPEHFDGKIWLDRKNKQLRLNYGKSTMIAKKGTLIVAQENERPQEYATDDTPAGILLRPSISFKSEGITVKSLTQIEDLWQLFLTYDSPAGSIPVNLYFKPKPIMILMGWAIENPNGSITNVHLNPDKTHMAIKIDPSVFKLN